MNQPLTVSEITSAIKEAISDIFYQICIVGEVSDIRFSKHLYLSLKDEKSSIDAVFWQWNKDYGPISSGSLLICWGYIDTYSAKSRYQLVIRKYQVSGEGEHSKSMELMKLKLQREGLFDQERKKRIPYLPINIGVITSVYGIVIKDILQRIEEKCWSNILIKQVVISGNQAEYQIIDSLDYLSNICDVIVIARGGGEAREFDVFNSEDLVRAIVSTSVPVITAIGHAVSTSLADMASDLALATPTEVANFVFVSKSEIINTILGIRDELFSAIIEIYDIYIAKLKELRELIKREFEKIIEKNLRTVSKIKYDLEMAITEKFSTIPRLVQDQRIITAISDLDESAPLEIKFYDGTKAVLQFKLLEITDT